MIVVCLVILALVLVVCVIMVEREIKDVVDRAEMLRRMTTQSAWNGTEEDTQP